MSNSFIKYDGDGTNRLFSIPFPYISRDHIGVFVGDLPVTFTFINNSQIQTTVAPASGTANVTIRRATPVDEPVATYTASTLKTSELNASAQQAIFGLQELRDQSLNGLISEAGQQAAAALVSANASAAARDSSEEHKNSAAVSEENAAGSEESAAKWASEDEDVPVEGGEYSAKHYSAKAADERSQAEDARAAAEGYRDEAETARDAAQLSAGVYPDKPAGIAATSSGDYFSVPAPEDNAYLILCKNNAGVADEVKYYPSKNAVDEIADRIQKEADGGTLVWAVEDVAGNAAIGVKPDGTFVAPALESAAVSTDTVSVRGTAFEAVPGDSDAYSIEDASGNKAFRIKASGAVAVNELEAATIGGVAVADILGNDIPESPDSGFTADVAHVICYGQSLSVGATSTPVITTAQRFDSLRFSGGVRPWDNTGGSNYGSLTPLVEQTGGGGTGETPVSGIAEMLKELTLTERGLSYTQHTHQILGSAPGFGGQTIAQLAKGGAYYNRVTNDITNGLSLSNAAGKSYRVLGTAFVHGEADTTSLTPRADYIAGLVTLAENIDATARSLTGQSKTVKMFVSQVSSHPLLGASYPDIALGQLSASLSTRSVRLTCPMYQFDYTTSDVHLTAASSKWLGAYHGIAMMREAIDGKKFEPLRPVLAYRQGSIIYLKFHVPVGKLVLDTTLVSAATNYGFAVKTSGGTPVTISSVAVTGPDTVRIVCSTSPGAQARVSYAFGTGSETSAGRTAGPRGNLRDQQGDTIVFDPAGLNKPMHNWCVLFEEILA